MGSAASTGKSSKESFSQDKSELRLSTSTGSTLSSFRFLSLSSFGGSNRSSNNSSSDSIRTSGRFRMNRSITEMVPSLLHEISRRDWKNVEESFEKYPQSMMVAVHMMLYGIERKLTPFHLICAFDPPIELMKIILTVPHIAEVLAEPLTIIKGNDGALNQSEISPRAQIDNMLPLHIAALYGASPEVILALLEVFPGAAKYKNAVGLLPIHIVCSGIRLKPPRAGSLSTTPHEPESNLLETVHILLRAYPGSIHTPCSSTHQDGNKTPVQYIKNVLLPNLIAHQSDTNYTEEEVQKVLELFSSNLNKLEPITFSSLNSEDMELKDSLKIKNSAPLSQTLRVSTIPSGKMKTTLWCKRTNKLSAKPSKLYMYIIERKWKEAMARIAKAPEEANIWVYMESCTADIAPLQSIDLSEEFEYSCHRLPLHRACANKPPLNLILALYEAYPEAIRFREKFGMTPLHIACNNGASLEVVAALMKMDPRSIVEKDTFGLLPLHLACTEGSNIVVISELLKANPGTAAATDLRGNRPIDYARGSFHPNKNEIIKALNRSAAFWYAGEFEEGRPTFPLYSLLKAKSWEGVKVYISQQPSQAKKWIIDKKSPWSNGYPCSPLYVACSNRAPVIVVQELINLNPESTRETCGQYDMLPLHAACSRGASFHVIEALLLAYPGGVREMENFGLLPLHIAVTDGASPKVVKALLRKYPESAEIKDAKGITPIDYANQSFAPNKMKVLEALRSSYESDESSFDYFDIGNKESPSTQECKIETTTKTINEFIDDADWGSILELVKDNPKEAETVLIGERDQKSYAQFPIHRVCSMQPPSIVVKALIDAYPSGLCSRTDYNEYPLHIACKYGASFGVVNDLVRGFDSAASVVDVSGRTPLHLAAIAGAEPSVFEILLKAARGTANVRDSEGNTALDYVQESHHRNKTFLIKVLERNKIRMDNVSAGIYDLVKNKKWTEIQSIVKRNPNEAKVWVFDKGYGSGRLALHLACSLNPPRGVIAILHNMNPKAVSTMEKDGRYALHVACQHNASVEVVQLLINTYPDALTTKDKFGFLPIHFACSDGASMEVIKLLLRSAPKSIFQKDTRGWTALDYSELTRFDHQHILSAVSPQSLPQKMRSNSMPPRVDFAKAFEKLRHDDHLNNSFDTLVSNSSEKFPKDPMTKRDIYQTYGFSKSARLLSNDFKTDMSEEALPEIT